MQLAIAKCYRQVRSRLAQFVSNNRFAQRLAKQLSPTWDFLSQYVRVHQAIIGLTIFIVVTNTFVAQAANQIPQLPKEALVNDPYQVADTLRIIGPYIPNNTADHDAVAIALDERVNGSFIKTNPLIPSQPSNTDDNGTSDQTSSSAPATNPEPAQRTQDTKYTVQIGDTLSGIGSKFDLKVATLQVKNDLSDADSIKPGQELIIPAQDLSDRAIRAAQDRQLASASVSKSAGTISAPRSGGYGFMVPIHYTVIARRLVGGHTGIDYDAPVGTPIAAAADGIVAIASYGWNGGYGTTVLQTVGSSGSETLRYGHMSSLAVSPGDHVHQGQIIGYSGNTGRSTGPHLHFELRVNGVPVDPGT